MFTNRLPAPIAASPDGHHLLAGDRLFFWLGDTAWELFHRPTRAEAKRYLADRAAKGFTVIQAVALAELDGLSEPNANGDRPLHDNDPTRPNEAYFQHVDDIIRSAAALGLYVALLPTWGDKLTPGWGIGPTVFSADNAYRYGCWLGARYRADSCVVWVLGGDRPPLHETYDHRPIWRAMAAGLADGLGRQPFTTYHPNGGHSSADWLHEEGWLSMHMAQSGHGSGRDVPIWEWVTRDYARLPARPVLDGEPNYEDHAVSPWPRWNPASGFFRDHDVRKQCWRSVLAGGCGVTYGHAAIWQWYAPPREPLNLPDRTWSEALDRPAAGQLRHLRALIESRPMLSRRPAQELIVGDAGSGARHARACRADDGAYAFVYLPEPRPIVIDLTLLSGADVRAWWYNPRSGAADQVGTLPAAGARQFQPPAAGPDWTLVLDDDSRAFAPPGAPPHPTDQR